MPITQVTTASNSTRSTHRPPSIFTSVKYVRSGELAPPSRARAASPFRATGTHAVVRVAFGFVPVDPHAETRSATTVATSGPRQRVAGMDGVSATNVTVVFRSEPDFVSAVGPPAAAAARF